MSNTFTKNSVRGFTLIELLVVIAIIGLLSTIIAAPIQNARKKARDAKKIAEVKAIQLALEQYAESNDGEYPTYLRSLSPAYMPVLPTYASSTTSSPRDAFGYVWYVGHSVGANPVRFAYHLGTKLEVFGPALDTDRDCIGASTGIALGADRCVVYNTADALGIQALRDSNGSLLIGTTTPYGLVASATTMVGTLNGDMDMVGTKLGTFIGEDALLDTCVGARNCVFDVTSQQ